MGGDTYWYVSFVIVQGEPKILMSLSSRFSYLTVQNYLSVYNSILILILNSD